MLFQLGDTGFESPPNPEIVGSSPIWGATGFGPQLRCNLVQVPSEACGFSTLLFCALFLYICYLSITFTKKLTDTSVASVYSPNLILICRGPEYRDSHSQASFCTFTSTECKFLCPTHSEAKQTETSEFGAEKGLLKGHARRTGGSCPPKPQTPQRVSAKCFKGKGRKGSPRVGDQLMHNSLIGWWWGNRVVSQVLTLSILRCQKVWGLLCSW